ncbi:MAG TPA: biopolymer transporter ExbD, partial [Proteobacteria bacterium]|nr:biopolymer transporter ExbD [Pseudomonadota bacterium]
EVNRPTAAKAGVLPGQSLLVGISEDGELWMEGKKVDISEIRGLVAERLKDTPDLNVVIVADKGSRVGLLVDVLDECKQAGAEKLSIAAKVERPEELE